MTLRPLGAGGRRSPRRSPPAWDLPGGIRIVGCGPRRPCRAGRATAAMTQAPSVYHCLQLTWNLKLGTWNFADAPSDPPCPASASATRPAWSTSPANWCTKYGVELISTGGTQKALADAGLPVNDVSELTGFPEILDGRVKTLHPAIYAGILAKRDKPEHMRTLAEHKLPEIDLVVCNLYPFEETVAKPGVTEAEAIENIDIGGPCMVRAAAKNFDAVAVVTDPAQYAEVLDELARTTAASSLATPAAARRPRVRPHRGVRRGDRRLLRTQAAATERRPDELAR